MVTFNNTGRLICVASLSALITACGTLGIGGKSGGSVVLDPGPVVGQRFGDAPGEDPRALLDNGQIQDDAPDTYLVVKGDTLWDISGKFLKEPWLWPTIWEVNPQIVNPHLIYPGDIIALEYYSGKPMLKITRGGTGRGATGRADGRDGARGTTGGAEGKDAYVYNGPTDVLSPQIREESLVDAIPTIPADSINSFLVQPKVVDNRTIKRAPYVVGNYDGRLISAVGHQIYVKGKLSRDQPHYGIYRRTKPLRDPISREILGYEVTQVSEAKLLHLGNRREPATLLITSNKKETVAGDILLPVASDAVVHNFVPRMPVLNGEGRIISLVDALSQSGRNQVVVLNLGSKTGMQVGDVLAVETRGGTFMDPRGNFWNKRIRKPSTRTGVVMVFKTFDEVSYALVMESTLPIKMGDAVTGI